MYRYVMPRIEDRVDAGSARRAAASAALLCTSAVIGGMHEGVPATNAQIRRRRVECA